MRNIELIVIHCSDTPDALDIGAAEIREWHVNDNGWSDIGYHYVIRRDGQVEKGRELGASGAHVRGYNRSSVGICLVGRRDFTRNQWHALYDIVRQVRSMTKAMRVVGHRDLDPGKSCPNFDVSEWMDDVLAAEEAA